MPGWGNQGWGTQGYTDDGDEVIDTGHGYWGNQYVWKNKKRPLTKEEVAAHGFRNLDAGTFFDDAGHELGFNPTLAGQDTAGASLDTTAADSERQRQQDFIQALQQQAATGDGAWRKAFDEGVIRSKQVAEAVGQSDPTTGNNAALENIGNAQASAQQRSVGDAARLRAESQQ